MLSLARQAAATPARIRTYTTVNGFTGAIGNTPLIKLEKLSRETGCTILGKAEFQNPGGSVKDRAALYVVKDAEEKDVRPVPAVPFENPDNYNHQAARFAEATPNAVWTDQFDNQANARAHYETTGPEIWQQTDGKIDAFVCATGTGGTLSGIGRFLREKREKGEGDTQVWLADPPGSVLHSYVASGGKLTERSGGSITEGIGQGRVTNNLAPEVNNLAGALHIKDESSVEMVYRLLDEEGIYVGASSALNVEAARQLAHKLGPGKTIVTIICDGAYRYQTRLFSRKWLESKNLVNAIPDHLKKYIILP
ncbi:hypothetical protein FRB99_006956 [Tulasnella sp. 403]|nr:hypothetical protein FRB99_006956 [Tulasnella sp. 403]